MRMVINDPLVPAHHPEEVPHVAMLYDRIPVYTNRLDRIFRSRNRQGDRGRHITGQAQFLRIYMQEMERERLAQIFMKLWYRVLDGIEDYEYLDLPFCHLLSCQHGHHRSQAVACLLQRLMRHYWEHVHVTVLHMDDHRHWKTKELLAASSAFRPTVVSGLRNALTPPIYYVPVHRPATIHDMVA